MISIGLLLVFKIQQIVFGIRTENPDFVQGTKEAKEQIRWRTTYLIIVEIHRKTRALL